MSRLDTRQELPKARPQARPPSPWAVDGAEPRILDWADLTLAATISGEGFLAHADGTLFRVEPGIPETQAEYADAVGYSVAPENGTRYAAALETVDRDRVRATIDERRRAYAVAQAGVHAQERTTRPVVHTYTLSSLLAQLDAAGVTLEARNGRSVLAFPRGSHVFSDGLRHAYQAFAPLLDGLATGKPVGCAERKCDGQADALLFPAYPVCARHAELVYTPAQDVELADWWDVPAVSIKPAGAEILRLPSPPEDRRSALGWPTNGRKPR